MFATKKSVTLTISFMRETCEDNQPYAGTKAISTRACPAAA